ncbi:phospholipase D-like domain-containing protein [Balneolaceae bacterium ANBcel3]|nr:phospholipase D-like domain-containing protein [Balneolaceae bacterium ANBcel3]
MDLQRGKLNEILAKDRYHSALITTYTFDPVFLKQIFLPTLHSKRIRNITILADHREIDRSFSEKENIANLIDAPFMLIPAQATSLFHPKVMLFAGRNEGLCVIGSGNLTHSGMGGNDEIWGAFHISNDHQQHAHIFRSVWTFLQKHTPQLTGVGDIKKNEWILDHAHWLQEVLTKTDEEHLDTSILSNDEELTIWEQVRSEISDKDIEEVVVTSPFYDKQGFIIREVRELFPHAKISMIYDERGTIPDITEEVKNLYCYCWQDMPHQNKRSNSKRHLHAKYLLFRESNGNEYLLFGSANATDSALGMNRNSTQTNVELSLLSRRADSEFSGLLGIDLEDVESKDIRGIEVKGLQYEEPAHSNTKKDLKICYAEQRTNKVSVVLIRRRDQDAPYLVLFDEQGRKISDFKISQEADLIFVLTLSSMGEEKRIPKAAIVRIGESGTEMPVYHHKTLSLNNPNPKLEIMRSALGDILNDDFGTLSGQLMKVFNQVSEKKEEEYLDKKSGSSTSQNKQGDESDSEVFIAKEKFREKKTHHHQSGADSSEFDSLMAIVKAMSKIRFDEKEPEATGESQVTDSSIEHDSSDDESEEGQPDQYQKTYSENDSRIRGYRSLLHRSLKFFKKFVEAHKKSDLESKPVIDDLFVGKWLLMGSIALTLIIKEAKIEPPDGGGENQDSELDKKTTILPHQQKNKLSIHDVVSTLIPPIIGRIRLDRVDLGQYLDRQERFEGAATMLLLLCFRPWGISEHAKYRKIYSGVLKVFRIEDDESFSEFWEYLIDLTGEMDPESFREKEWRYYRSFYDSFRLLQKF